MRRRLPLPRTWLVAAFLLLAVGVWWGLTNGGSGSDARLDLAGFERDGGGTQLAVVASRSALGHVRRAPVAERLSVALGSPALAVSPGVHSLVRAAHGDRS